MNYSSCCLYSYTQVFTQIDTAYFKKNLLEISSNGLVELLFIFIEKLIRCYYAYAYLKHY